MKRNLIWKFLLGIGIVPFAVVIVFGIYNAINGYSGLCLSCTPNYGLSAFIDSIILYSYLFWPTYIIGFILVILSIVMLKKK